MAELTAQGNRQFNSRGSDSLMQEDAGDEALYESEYTYSDQDTQYDRKRSLERHSSADVTDIPIVKIIEGQVAQTENDASKPIVSYMQSFFRAGSSGPNMGWLSGSGANKKDPSRLNLENIMKLSEPSDVIEALNRAMELKNAVYTQAALDLVTHLCEQDKSKNTSVSLGAEGACSVVDHILGLNMTSLPLTEAALRTVCSLITPVSPTYEKAAGLAAASAGICVTSAEAGVSNNRRRFSSAGSVYQVIKAATTHVADEIALEWGLRVLFYLSLEQGLVQRVIACGGCDLLALALRTHSNCDDIVVWTCRTLCHCVLTLDAMSAQDRTVCQDKLAQQLVLEILISEFSERMTAIGKLAAQWTLKAIGCLARRHEGNMHTFVELGVCEMLHNVQQQFTLEDEKMAESLCWVIGNLSYPSEEAQARWGACGACDVVLTTLRKHVNSEETVQEALRALRNLCYDNESNLELLRGLQVASMVMSVIRRHQESSGVVLQWLWYAVAGLAEYRPLVLQLGAEDVCSAAVASITRFSARPDLVQWTALAIANLALELKLSVELGQANCCEVLVHVLTEHKGDEDVVEEILSAIGNLSANCIENRASFHRAGVEAAVLKAIAKHEKNEAVVEMGLSAIARLVQGGVEVGTPASEDTAQVSENSQHRPEDSLLRAAPQTAVVVGKIVVALVKADGCKIIARALHRHAGVYRIAELGSKALSDIGLYGFNEDERRYSEALRGTTLPSKTARVPTVESITNRPQVSASTKGEEAILVPLGQSGAPAALTAVLQSYMSDLTIVYWALLALDHIASSARNLPILHAAGVDSLLVLALQAHFVHDHAVVNLCYSLIAHFAFAEECRERMGKQSGGEVLLVSLAHNMSATLPAKLGADAISALCLSPQYDAVAMMASKDSLGPSYDELDVNQRSAMKAQGAERPRSRSNSATDDMAGAAAEAQQSITRPFGSIFGWTSTTTNTSAKSEKSIALPKTITTFELMSKRALDSNNSRGGLLGYAHGAFVSKGMTDQEEEMHTARALEKSRKSNSSVLIKNGVTTILLTVLDKHSRVGEVQIAAVNALNSLALDATHRNELNHEGVFESMVRAYADCLRIPAMSRKVDLDTSIVTLDGSEHGLVDDTTDTPIKQPAASAEASADPASPAALEDDETTLATRRVLLVMLNIAFGTLCLPLAEEVEGLTAHSDNCFAAANQNVLGKLGACELIAECMKAHARDPLVCEATLRAIYYLSRSNEANQLRLGVAGAVSLVMAAMRTFFFKPHIVYYCCLCIAGLAHGNVINADGFDECEVADLLYKVLNMYVEQAEVVEAACYAIYALRELNHRMGDLCKLVVNALVSHPDSVSVCQYACMAIGSLSELHANKVLLEKNNVCNAVTAALQKYVASNSMLSTVFMREDTSNAAVAKWGCTAIYYIARGTDSLEYQQKLVTAGACEAVTKALLKYSEYESIAHACFRSLVVLLINNATYKTKLGALGVCGCVVEAMHMFPYSAQVAKWGCRAVAVLAESHEANIARLGVAGACESIPVILQAHPGSEYVASAGCDVISFMSETLTNGFAARFGQAGGCEAVVTVLRTHAANAHVVTRASIAVASLSRVKGNATWMGPAGACDALMNVMQVHHADVAVSKFIISAMGNLCIIDNNRERLGTLGACEIIVSSARLHMQDLDTAKAAALAMGKLCEHIFRSEGSDDPLAHLAAGGTGTADQSGLLAAAAQAQAALDAAGGEQAGIKGSAPTPVQPGSGAVSPEAQSAVLEREFQSLNDPNTGVRRPSPSTSSASLLQQAASPVTASPGATGSGRNSPMPSSSTKAPAAQLSAVALAHATAGRRNRGRLFDADYCSVLVSLLTYHNTDADAIRIISRTITIVAFGDACIAEREALAAVGACKALAKAIQYHEGNEGIGRSVCWAIKAMCHHHQRNRDEFRVSGVCAPILVVLRGFRYSKNAVETVQGAAAAIANLCQDNPGNKAAMGAAGACEGLLEVLELHYRNIEVAYLCSKALYQVCDGNHENRLKISFSGAADILMNVTNRYIDEERILDYVFSIMIGMCLGKVGQSRLGTVGVAKAAVTALYRYEKSSEYLVLLCCALIHALAVNSLDNQNKLGAAGACKAIASVAARYVRSTTYHATNMRILTTNKAAVKTTSSMVDAEIAAELAAEASAKNADPSAALGSGSADVGPLLSKDPLSEIIGEFSVLKECCKAVVFLSSGNDANRQKLQATPLLDTLTPVLSTAVPYTFPLGGGPPVSGNISAETLKWVRSAVDVLMGKL